MLLIRAMSVYSGPKLVILPVVCEWYCLTFDIVLLFLYVGVVCVELRWLDPVGMIR